MKNLIYIFILAALLTACSKDFLEQKSPDQLTSQNFWRNKSDAEAGLAAVYAQIEYTISYWGYAEVKYVIDTYRSDLCEPGADAANYPDWMQISTFSNTSSNTQCSEYWRSNYRGINYANQVIEKVGGMSAEQIKEADKNQIVAEAEFLRAFFNFKLICNWEKIILRVHPINSESDLDQGLAERIAVWDQIVSDFEAAIPSLPSKSELSNDNVGRATKEAAYGMLGKVFLYRAGEETAKAEEYYQKAVDALWQVIDGGLYSLQNNFRSLFDGTGQNSNESLFEIQFAASEDNGVYYKFPKQYWIAVSELGGWDEIRGTDYLLQQMKSEGQIATGGMFDDRLYSSLLFDDPNSGIWGYAYDDLFGTDRKIAFTKYLPATEDEMFQWESPINEHLLRYADVLLMYAEALNELNRTAEAIPYINQVRTRAQMPAMTGSGKTEVKNQVIHERIMEFAMEGQRFFDLRRWGLLEDRMHNSGKPGASNFNLNSHSFFPIPESESNSNGGL